MPSTTLTPGTRLGPYEIVAPLGAGGMGEVYRARDTRLDRIVAIKVLPADFASDPQSRARFDREARAISQLTHPHICTLHDVGVEGDTPYLVMELLQGQTLAERLTKGALPLDEALTIAVQIADALSAAHKHGIVHRDLKPLNIMLTKSGAKLLDFGLAKAATPAVTVGAGSTHATASAHLTGTGTILGTLHYMSPEQVEGREADTRSDLWSLGAVIYEMITGQLAFAGESSAAVVGAILKDRPLPLADKRPAVPLGLDHLVARCLEKDPDERWQAASDVKRELAWLASPANLTSAGPHGSAQTHRRAGARVAWAVAAGAVVLAGLLALPAARHLRETSPPALPVQFSLQAPLDALWTPAPVVSTAQFALSADGRRLAFVAGRSGGSPQIWVRALDRLKAEAVAGTDGASFPFWSPDGRSIGFFSEGRLKTIDTTGGVPQILADAPGGRGGAWGPDGTILFAGRVNTPIARIPATGGSVAAATTLDQSSGAVGHTWPQFLPDGRHFLFYQRGATPEAYGVYVGSLDSPAMTLVLRSVSMGVYSSGHLLFARDSMLFAQAFDLPSLTVNGASVRVADRVGYDSAAFGYMAASASSTGTLVTGPGVAATTELRWFDRAGSPLGVAGAPAIHMSPRLSPDQRSVAVSIYDPNAAQRDVWVLDLARGAASRATFDPGMDWFPAWAPAGNRLFFSSLRNDGASMTIYQKSGADPDRAFGGLVQTPGQSVYLNDVSSDGRYLLYTETGSHAYDLNTVTTSDTPEPSSPFLSTPFNEAQGRFSPDTRWVTYSSDESGRFEVYVRRFPAANEQWRVSIAGGQQPEWRRDGKELFYVAPDHKLMAVPVTSDGGTFTAGTPHALFDVVMPEVSAPYPTEYAVAADGRRFLVNTVVEQKNQPTLTVVLNWLEQLRAKASSQ